MATKRTLLRQKLQIRREIYPKFLCLIVCIVSIFLYFFFWSENFNALAETPDEWAIYLTEQTSAKVFNSYPEYIEQLLTGDIRKVDIVKLLELAKELNAAEVKGPWLGSDACLVPDVRILGHTSEFMSALIEENELIDDSRLFDEYLILVTTLLKIGNVHLSEDAILNVVRSISAANVVMAFSEAHGYSNESIYFISQFQYYIYKELLGGWIKAVDKYKVVLDISAELYAKNNWIAFMDLIKKDPALLKAKSATVYPTKDLILLFEYSDKIAGFVVENAIKVYPEPSTRWYNSTSSKILQLIFYKLNIPEVALWLDLREYEKLLKDTRLKLKLYEEGRIIIDYEYYLEREAHYLEKISMYKTLSYVVFVHHTIEFLWEFIKYIDEIS